MGYMEMRTRFMLHYQLMDDIDVSLFYSAVIRYICYNLLLLILMSSIIHDLAKILNY